MMHHLIRRVSDRVPRWQPSRGESWPFFAAYAVVIACVIAALIWR